MKPITKICGIIGLCMASAMLGPCVFKQPTLRVVAQWEQPAAIHYHSYDPYVLSVREMEREYGLNWERSHAIFIGRKGNLDYGHLVRHSFHPDGGDMEAHIKKSSVEWSDDGVMFIEASGHRVFIPKIMFVGGR